MAKTLDNDSEQKRGNRIALIVGLAIFVALLIIRAMLK